MNTTISIIIGASLYAAAGEAIATKSYVTPEMGAVAALGATLLLVVGKYLPSRDKANAEQTEKFTAAVDTITQRYAKSMDEFGERHDKTVLELTNRE